MKESELKDKMVFINQNKDIAKIISYDGNYKYYINGNYVDTFGSPMMLLIINEDLLKHGFKLLELNETN